MTVVDLKKDLERHTLTIVAEYTAAGDRVWQLWADPRQLERWWGPPSHPATVTDHDLSRDGTVRYFMTAPDGARYHGGWRVIRTEAPHGLEFVDFFANEDGTVNAGLPSSRTAVSIDDSGAGSTKMTIETSYASAEEMQQVLDMGMEEGIRQALGQIESLLGERSA